MSKVKRLVVLGLFVAGLSLGVAQELRGDDWHSYCMGYYDRWETKCSKYYPAPSCRQVALQERVKYC